MIGSRLGFEAPGRRDVYRARRDGYRYPSGTRLAYDPDFERPGLWCFRNRSR